MKFSETFSSTTRTLINFDLYLPAVMIRYKGVVQIHHAMGEYVGRYRRFAEYLVIFRVMECLYIIMNKDILVLVMQQ